MGIKLNLACGSNKMEGWVNIDIRKDADMVHDLEEEGIPYPDNTVEFIYCEHFIEHLDHHQGIRFLAECLRALKPGGVARICTPNLRELCMDYLSGEWRERWWVQTHCRDLRNGCEMMNASFSWWGHKYIYDEEDLANSLKEAGFTDITIETFQHSAHASLTKVDTRPDSIFIEARK